MLGAHEIHTYRPYEPARGNDSSRRSRVPSLDQLKWVKTALEVFILLLAVPWLLHELIKHPGDLTKKIAGHHMKA